MSNDSGQVYGRYPAQMNAGAGRGYVDEYGIEKECRARWETNPGVRAEFLTFENFRAYEKNRHLVRVLGE